MNNATKGGLPIKKGFALVFIMAFTAVITVFTASVGAQASFNLRMATQRGEADRAYYSAQTGTQLILSLLREPPPTLDYDGDGNPGSWLGEDGSLNLSIDSTQADALAHVFHNIQGYPNAVTTAPDGTTIPPDHFYIVSVGVVNGIYDADGDLQSGTEYEATTMGATLNPSFPITPYAVFGFNSIDINGDIAHFDSRGATPWVVANGGGATHMDCPFPEASVGISTTSEANVTIGDEADIDGHILFGVGTADAERNNESAAIGGLTGGAAPNVPAVGTTTKYGDPGAVTATSGGSQPHVNGEIDALLSNQTVVDMTPEPSDVEQTFSSGYSGSYTLEEGKLYLKQGDLQVVGPSTITVNDSNGDGEIEDAILLVEDDIRFLNVQIGSNGSPPPATPPRNLKVYSLGTGTTFRMENSEAFCLVAGNDLTAEIVTDSTLWGAILANDVTVDDTSAVNFDVMLRDPTLIADIYGYYLTGSSITSGARVATGTLGPTGTTAPAPAPAPAPAAAPAAAPAPAPAPAPATGCGCGCGCGSMLMMQK